MKVKIQLNKNQTIEDAEELLFKALDLHRSGDIHLLESFDDPAMIDVSQRMEKIYEDIYKDMMDEIIEALGDDYSGY